MVTKPVHYRYALWLTAAALLAASCVPPKRQQPPHPPRPRLSSALLMAFVPLLQQVNNLVEFHRIIDVRR